MSAPADAGLERRSRSPGATERLGEGLAAALRTGDVLVLRGPLGSGKTCFAGGLARGLGVKGRVRSPSFGLVHEYHGRLLLVHADLYRLAEAEAEELGLEELREQGALVVEWGEKLPAGLREGALTLSFGIVAASERAIAAAPSGARGAELLEAWRRLEVPDDGEPAP